MSNKTKILNLIKNSIVAGILIGFGCITNVLCENHIIGAFLFSLGLLTVIIQGRYLFTGKIGYYDGSAMNLFNISIGLIVNLVSIWLFCFLFAKLSCLPLECYGLVDKKLHEGITEALVKSLGCGAMMYIAVNGYNKTNKPITVIMPVMVFILCGFDHCVANFGYMGLCGCFLIPIQLICWIIGNTFGSWLISKV